MPKLAPPPPTRGLSQDAASSTQPVSSLVSEGPARRKICGGVVAPSGSDPASDDRRRLDKNPVSKASSAGETAETSADVAIVGYSSGGLKQAEANNFTLTVKIEEPWDSGYLENEVPRRDSQAATGTSKCAGTTSSANGGRAKEKPKARSLVVVCSRVPNVPRTKSLSKAGGAAREPAVKDGAARREKKTTAGKTPVKPFEAAVITKLNSIHSALEKPMPPRNPDAAVATKSKPRGRKNQEMVLAGGTKTPRGRAIAETTPRRPSSKKTAVRRAKNGETPVASCKVPNRVQSTYELRRRSTKFERDIEAATAASIAEAASLQAAGERSESNDDTPGDGVNASQGNDGPAADKSPRRASTSKVSYFVPHGVVSSVAASADVVDRGAEHSPQRVSSAAPLASSTGDLRPVLLQGEASVTFQYSTLRGVISSSDGAANLSATPPSAAAPDLDSRGDEGIVNTEASASAQQVSASLESCPVESGDARSCNDPALPTEPQRIAGTSTQSECGENSDGTQCDSSAPAETSSHDKGSASEAIAHEPLENFTAEEAASAAVDAMESNGETLPLSAPGDCRDDAGLLGTSTHASAEDSEANGAVGDVGAQEPVRSRTNQSLKRRRTDADVTLEPEPITAVAKSVQPEHDNSVANAPTLECTHPGQRECADGEDTPEMSEGVLTPRIITHYNRDEGRDVPQGLRSPPVAGSSTCQGNLPRPLKVRIVASSESSMGGSQSTLETDSDISLPQRQFAGTSECIGPPQGQHAYEELCSGLPTHHANKASSELSHSGDGPLPNSESSPQNDDDCMVIVVTSPQPRRERSAVGGTPTPDLAPFAIGDQLLPQQSGSTGCRCTTCDSNRPPEELELERFLSFLRRYHASTHAHPNAPATAETVTAESNQPRLVPPIYDYTMRDNSSASRRQPAAAAADDDDVIAELCELSRGRRHREDDVASGRRLCHCRRALATASQTRATAHGPRDATTGEATTATSFLSGTQARAIRRAALFELNSMRALHVLQLCQDERTRRVVLQLYNEGRNSLAMEAYAAEIHALVRSAVDRARLDSSALAGFLQDMSNAEWLFPDTPRRSAGGPQLRNMRDQS